MQETQVQSLSWEDPLEEEMATHSSIPSWESPWTQNPDRLQSVGSQRVRQYWAHTPPFKHRSFSKCVFTDSFLWLLPSTSFQFHQFSCSPRFSPFIIQLTTTFSESNIALPFSHWSHFSSFPPPLPTISCSPKALRPVRSFPQSLFPGNRGNVYTLRCHSWRLPITIIFNMWPHE